MIAALYVRDKSVYSRIPGVDVWTKGRDARKWPGGTPCIAHPPCRGWGKYRTWAKVEPGELELAVLAVEQVRENGGILEHPVGSALWKELDLPAPGEPPDEWGGYTVQIRQCDFGHRGQKAAWLYCCGVQLPPMPRPISGEFVPVENMGRPEREATPPLFATWLAMAALSARK